MCQQPIYAFKANQPMRAAAVGPYIYDSIRAATTGKTNRAYTKAIPEAATHIFCMPPMVGSGVLIVREWCSSPPLKGAVNFDSFNFRIGCL